MTVLVTGGAGFVAAHLAVELKRSRWNVVLTDAINRYDPDIRIADLANASAIRSLIAEVKPDAVVHLGAISFVPDAATDVETLELVNVGGTRNVLEAVRNEVPNARFLFVSTAHVLNYPLSDYAKSKIAAEKVVAQYAKYGLNTVIARPANHTGPGQSRKFVVPSFVGQARDIKLGIRKKFRVGNLESVRDFTDVRDVVRAYRMLLEIDDVSGVYNICSDCRMSIRQLLEKIASIIGVDSCCEVDQNIWRPGDMSTVVNTERIKVLGWKPEIAIEQTIYDIDRSL